MITATYCPDNPRSTRSAAVKTAESGCPSETLDSSYNEPPTVDNDSSNVESSVSNSQKVAYKDESCESKAAETTNAFETMSRKRIVKNLLVVSIVFLLLFTAIVGLDALQSSLLKEDGLGMICQATKFAAMILSCLLLPTLAIQALGHKWCISACFVGYLTWMLANGYAVWATMVPASVLIGLAGACIWVAVNSYLSFSAHQYAAITGQDSGPVVTRFFGIFYCIFLICGVTGSVISSTVLSLRPENVTSPSDEDLQTYCGLADCPSSNFTNTNLDKPSPKVIWTLIGIYFGLAAVAFVIWCVFVDPLPSSALRTEYKDAGTAAAADGDDNDGARCCCRGRGRCKRPPCKSALWSMTSTLRNLKHVALLLMIPMTVSDSLAFVFRTAEYTRSFVSCYLGMWMIGWVSVPASVMGIVAALVGGQTTKFIGILPMFLFGSGCIFAYQLTLIYWTPSASQDILFYVVACVDMIGASVIRFELSAFYGLLFPDEPEAAFANYKLWDSVGCLIAFAYSSVLCTDIKLYLSTASLLVGTALVVVVYFAYYRRSKAQTYHFDVDTTVL